MQKIIRSYNEVSFCIIYAPQYTHIEQMLDVFFSMNQRSCPSDSFQPTCINVLSIPGLRIIVCWVDYPMQSNQFFYIQLLLEGTVPPNPHSSFNLRRKSSFFYAIVQIFMRDKETFILFRSRQREINTGKTNHFHHSAACLHTFNLLFLQLYSFLVLVQYNWKNFFFLYNVVQ